MGWDKVPREMLEKAAKSWEEVPSCFLTRHCPPDLALQNRVGGSKAGCVIDITHQGPVPEPGLPSRAAALLGAGARVVSRHRLKTKVTETTC